MNRIYRLIWSRVTNTWVAVSENSKGQSKSGRGAVLRRKAIAAAISLAFAPLAQANPIGSQVVSGNASINQSGNLLTVTNSPNAIINWQGFSIGSNETTRFIQQSSSSSVLNRVVGADPSSLLGTLTSNGKVFLINPAGILVGQGARINVSGFVASTLNLSNADFLAGNLNFTNPSPTGGGVSSVINQGTITTPEGGSVYLVAPQVENQGIINTPKGETILAAGNTVQLVDTGTPGVSVQITGSSNTATNLGQILADSGRIGMVGAVVNNSGTISANSLVSQGGKIFLKAINHVEAGGTISAEGVGGGSISVLADKQSGTVKVTGTLDASAPNSGNGGFIETSAKQVTVAGDAKVTTAASMGLAGSWLLDPYDFTIAASGGDITGLALSTALGLGSVTIQTNLSSVSCTGATCLAGTSTGTGNINVNDTVSWSANTLTLNAYNNININNTMNGSGTASLALYYGQGAVAAGNTSTYNVNASVNLSAGQNFSTKLGSDGAVTNYTVITSLGAAADATTSPATMTLQGLAATANLTGNYVLGANIDATATSAWNTNAGFTPIGNSTSQFTGTFDGLGHSINNLTIKLPTTNYVGLFGYLGTSSVIQNLGLVNMNITSVTNYVGELAGNNFGTIRNSYATGSVNGGNGYYIGGLVGGNYGTGLITNSYAMDSVSGQYYVGGLTGYNVGGKISNSYATGSVTGNSWVGGLAGINTGTINNAYATGMISGSIAGGTVGWNVATLNNVYATGNVTSTGNEVGGLVGNNAGTVSNSYATGNVTSTGIDVGGLVGYNSGTINYSYALGGATGSDFVGGLAGVNQGTILVAYSKGHVTGTGSNIGGLVGQNATYSTWAYGYYSSYYTSYSYSCGFSTCYGGYWTTYWVSTPYLVATTHNGTLTLSYWDTQTSGTLVGVGSGGAFGSGVGLSTTQMQTASNFPGFAFSSTPGAANSWVIIDANGTLNNDATRTLSGSSVSGSTVTVTNTSGLSVGGTVTGGGFPAGTTITGINNSTTFTTSAAGTSGSGVTLTFVANGATYPMLASEYSTTINNSHQLQLMAMNPVASYALGQNIDASTTGNNVDVWGAYGFVPVGAATSPFYGSFNGMGHTINNLTVNDSTISGAGLFGVAYTGSVIQNVGLVNNLINGNYGVGGLVGVSYGTVNNSYATGSVNGTGISVGGLVGQISGGTVSNSYASGSVNGSSSVGGLAGYNLGTISNSYSNASVNGTSYVGGLVGANTGTINNTYTTGFVSGTNYLGGLVAANSGTVTNSYWDTQTSGQAISSAAGTGVSTAGMQNASFLTLNNSGFSFTTIPGTSGWVIVDVDGSLNNAGNVAGSTFPMLASEYSSTINNTHQLQLMAMNPAANYTLGQNINASTTGNSTDIWSAYGFAPIGNSTTPFTGTYNGMGYSISNLTIKLPTLSYVGLFGYTGTNSLIQNVGLVNDNVSGNYDVGGLVGLNKGAVNSSYVTGTVSGTNSVGGLVGYNYGMVNNSYATSSVSGTLNSIGGLVGIDNGGAISNSYATGNVNGSGKYVGGLVGLENIGTVSNSYATGSVSGLGNYVGGLEGVNQGGSIINSYAIGSVNGSNYVGGLVGGSAGNVSISYATGSVSGTGNTVGGLVGLNTGSVNNSFWDIPTSGQVTSAGGTGLTATQMEQEASFTGWNIANTGGSGAIWRIYEGHTAPLLSSFLTPLTLAGGPDASVTYNGSVQSGGTTTVAGLLGTAASGRNVGFYNGYYSTQQGYDIIGGNLTITPLSITVTATGINKVYDGNAYDAASFSSSGVISGDALNFAYSSAIFANQTIGSGKYATQLSGADVGYNKTVNVSGIELVGADASNYTLNNTTATTTANITPKPVSPPPPHYNNYHWGASGTTAPTVQVSSPALYPVSVPVVQPLSIPSGYVLSLQPVIYALSVQTILNTVFLPTLVPIWEQHRANYKKWW